MALLLVSSVRLQWPLKGFLFVPKENPKEPLSTLIHHMLLDDLPYNVTNIQIKGLALISMDNPIN